MMLVRGDVYQWGVVGVQHLSTLTPTIPFHLHPYMKAGNTYNQ